MKTWIASGKTFVQWTTRDQDSKELVWKARLGSVGAALTVKRGGRKVMETSLLKKDLQVLLEVWDDKS